MCLSMHKSNIIPLKSSILVANFEGSKLAHTFLQVHLNKSDLHYSLSECPPSSMLAMQHRPERVSASRELTRGDFSNFASAEKKETALLEYKNQFQPAVLSTLVLLDTKNPGGMVCHG